MKPTDEKMGPDATNLGRVVTQWTVSGGEWTNKEDHGLNRQSGRRQTAGEEGKTGRR